MFFITRVNTLRLTYISYGRVSNVVFHLCHISSTNQVAELYTKPLFHHRFEFLRSKLQVNPSLEHVGGDKLYSKEQVNDLVSYLSILSDCNLFY